MNRDDRHTRTLLTPEGIPLQLTLAQPGDRAAAFLVDFMVLSGAQVVVYVLLFSVIGLSGVLVPPVLLVVAFLVNNFYFPYFEARWQGSTPGKRSVGIRVISRNGGPLTASAVIGRNLVRDVELWIPLQLIVAGETVWPGAPTWARLAASAWGVVLLLLPLFNRDHLRAGDLVGGTLVVRAPRTLLLPDVAEEAQRPRRGDKATSFSDAQLNVYGIYELQVLEDLLRAPPGPSHDEALSAVYTRIVKKIAWPSPTEKVGERERFLHDFYAALRAHLERKALFGKRKQDKYSA